MRYLPLFLIFFSFVSTTNAQVVSYSRTPAGVSSETYQSMNFNIEITSFDDLCPTGNPWDPAYTQWGVTLSSIYGNELFSAPAFGTTLATEWFFDNDIEVRQVMLYCEDSINHIRSSGMYSLEFLGGNEPFAVIFNTQTYVPPPPPPPPAPGIGFINYDDVTPQDMIASVQGGVVATTDKTLPLLVFVGIPVGFAIVLFLIGMINNTLTPAPTGKKRGRKTIINPGGDDIVYHSAKDLEFKRNYGQKKNL